MLISGQPPVYHDFGGVSYDADMTNGKERDTVSAAPLFRYMSESEMSQADFARQIHESPQTITNWKSRGVPKGKLIDVARAMRISVEQYLHQASNRELKRVAGGLRAAITKLEHPITVPVLSAEGSMGGGRLAPAHEAIVGGLTISREWLRGNIPMLSSLNNLAVISAFGQSMSPTFSDGDILLVDRGITEAKIDAVFVIGRGDELFVKRIQRRLNGDIVIRSDNPLFEPEVVAGAEVESVRILGRVVWAWTGKKL